MRRPLNYGSENGLHYTYQSTFEITDSRSFFVMKFHINNPYDLSTELQHLNCPQFNYCCSSTLRQDMVLIMSLRNRPHNNQFEKELEFRT